MYLHVWSMCLFSHLFFLPFSSSFFTRSANSRRVPPCELGHAQGFFLLKGNSMLVRSRALGFCKTPRDNFDCNNHCKMNWTQRWTELNWRDSETLCQGKGARCVMGPCRSRLNRPGGMAWHCYVGHSESASMFSLHDDVTCAVFPGPAVGCKEDRCAS